MSRILVLLSIILMTQPAEAARHAVVLQYQHISDRTPPSKSTTEEEFVQHLDYLEQQGFTVWPLEKIISALKTKKVIPDKTVALTFDNAYISVYEVALRYLSERNLPFTVFVSSEPVMKEHPLYMSWKQLQEVVAAGGSIGGMGLTGDNLAKPLPGERRDQHLLRVKRDIELGQQAIQHHLGIMPKLFAYPEGQADSDLRKLIADKGLIAFGLHQGPVSRYTPMNYLPRFTATGTARNITNLSVKLSSLPLPVYRVAADPDPLPTQNRFPEATVMLYSGSYQLSGLRCKNAEGQSVSAYIQPEGQRVSFLLKSQQGEDIGPIEYYCTAPHDKSTRFYWFSYTWIRPNSEGRW